MVSAVVSKVLSVVSVVDPHPARTRLIVKIRMKCRIVFNIALPSDCDLILVHDQIPIEARKYLQRIVFLIITFKLIAERNLPLQAFNHF